VAGLAIEKGFRGRLAGIARSFPFPGATARYINGSSNCFTFSPSIRSEKTCDSGVLNITRSMKTLRIFCSQLYYKNAL
jgi:hypothetical protein